MKEIYEGITKVIKYELLGKLPNSFVFNNGEKVKTVNDWNERKKEIYEKLSYLSYAPVIFISAKTGQRVDKLFDMINHVAEQNANDGILNCHLQREGKGANGIRIGKELHKVSQ